MKQILFCNISPFTANRRQSLNLNPGLSDAQMAELTSKVMMKPRRTTSNSSMKDLVPGLQIVEGTGFRHALDSEESTPAPLC